MNRPRAFSLIELSVVLVIVAIAAAAVTLNARGRMRHVTLADAVGAFVAYERTTRVAARQQDRPMVLSIDVSGGEVRRVSTDDGRPESVPMTLPGRVSVARVLIRDRRIDYGAAAIRINTHGLSCTYAVLLGDGTRSQWLVVPGLTGRIVEVGDEDEVLDILAATGPRSDAG
jgi:prepilin-type N-terminal cleavage/methylation domain-containing protein